MGQTFATHAQIDWLRSFDLFDFLGMFKIVRINRLKLSELCRSDFSSDELCSTLGPLSC